MERRPRDNPVQPPPIPATPPPLHATEDPEPVLEAHPRYRAGDNAFNREQGFMLIYIMVLAFLVYHLLRVYVSRFWTYLTTPKTVNSDKKAQ
jgi:hypothetical protein